MISQPCPPVLVACPDARPPAYQAVVGLSRAGMLDRFLTAYYYRGEGPLSAMGRKLAPAPYSRLQRNLRRRHDPEIPVGRVRSQWDYDASLRIENHLASRGSRLRGPMARWRTRRFDRGIARQIGSQLPASLLIFSDVGSQYTLPLCRTMGIPTILSMVHGDVREEQVVLEREAERSPDFFPIYLGDGSLDREELTWLHERRLRDLELADRILVPSEHIAQTLVRFGTPASRVVVVPYAADTNRFKPAPQKPHTSSCTFLFAGGITQRKGIKYLLEAWRRIRRPGWRLQLLGALPSDPGPLLGYLDEVDHLGRVSHSEMPGLMASADVFVFPSLFEGSAVVTYEALACGLPSVVTLESGAVARDGLDGVVVPAGDVERLAEAMERLGNNPGLREAMSASARTRAEAFDWPRYHAAVTRVARDITG
ncbi:glycosyltransferase [Singulisphaera rosea]